MTTVSVTDNVTTVSVTNNVVTIVRATTQGATGATGAAGAAGSIGAWGSPTEVTIASGVAALTSEGYYSIDTETDADSDLLTQITGLSDGDEVILKAENDARTVVVTNGAYIKMNNGADFTMNSIYDRIRLQCIGSDICVELSRSSGGS